MLNDSAQQDSDAITAESAPGTDTEISVRIDDLVKVFQEDSGGEIVAVDGVSIDVTDGEFLVLVGPSGCGKTTTLRSVAGLETPTEGVISIDGEDVTGLDPRERDISMVFQNYALYPHKTIRENISFPLEVRNYEDEEIESRVEETADLLDISELLDRKPNQLSGGQQQRVALGRAIVRQPSVFLMDEPLSNLDAKLRVQMRTELNELHKRLDKSTIYVTHDQAEAMTLGDRVAVMNNGRIQQIDPPQTLYENPATKFVAGFIGEPPMNFFTIECRETDSGYCVVSDVFDLELPDSMARELNAWEGALDSAILGIRPEEINDVEQMSNIDTENRFDALVKVVEPMGSDTFLTLTSVDGDTEFTAAVEPETNAKEGEIITLVPNLEKSHVFDERTEENITQ